MADYLDSQKKDDWLYYAYIMYLITHIPVLSAMIYFNGISGVMHLLTLTTGSALVVFVSTFTLGTCIMGCSFVLYWVTRSKNESVLMFLGLLLILPGLRIVPVFLISYLVIHSALKIADFFS